MYVFIYILMMFTYWIDFQNDNVRFITPPQICNNNSQHSKLSPSLMYGGTNTNCTLLPEDVQLQSGLSK
jgi:hypothetical protein